MKKIEILVKSWLLIVLISCADKEMFAQWNYLGSSAISDSWSTYNQIDCKINGTPVIAYTSQNTGHCKIWEGTTWMSLGSTLNEWNVGNLYDLQIDESDRVVLSFEDGLTGTPNLIRYDGIGWEQICTNIPHDEFVSELVMAIDSNQLVWCALITPGGFKLLKETNGDWELQNTSGLPGNFGLIDLVFDNDGYLLMAFTDVNELKGNVMRLNNGNWTFVGGQNYTTGFAQNNRIAVSADGTLYHGYDLNVIHLNMFDSSSGEWEQTVPPGFVSNMTGIWDLKSDNQNNVFLSTSQIAGDRARCYRINGSFWEQLGVNGISESVAGYPEIGIGNGQLYAVYNDFDLSAASVKKYDGLLGTAVNEAFVQVFPNPITDRISLHIKGINEGEIIVKIYSIQGELLLESGYSNNTGGIPIHLVAGSYIAVIQTDQGFSAHSLVKL
jgi:hypothetical protein